jgi:hypothetical protein
LTYSSLQSRITASILDLREFTLSEISSRAKHQTNQTNDAQRGV